MAKLSIFSDGLGMFFLCVAALWWVPNIKKALGE